MHPSYSWNIPMIIPWILPANGGPARFSRRFPAGIPTREGRERPREGPRVRPTLAQECRRPRFGRVDGPGAVAQRRRDDGAAARTDHGTMLDVTRPQERRAGGIRSEQSPPGVPTISLGSAVAEDGGRRGWIPSQRPRPSAPIFRNEPTDHFCSLRPGARGSWIEAVAARDEATSVDGAGDAGGRRTRRRRETNPLRGPWRKKRTQFGPRRRQNEPISGQSAPNEPKPGGNG
jgi:hypothetical protein